MFVRSLTLYLESNNLLMSNLHGFRQGKSTVTNLLECDSFIFNLLNSGNPYVCDVIMFDFRRAFDKVDHNILCHELKNIGVDRCYLKWIINYLSGRKHFVSYNTAQCDTAMVTSGVVK